MILVRFQGFANVFSLGGGGYAHLSEQIAKFYTLQKVPLVVSDPHPLAIECALHQSGLTYAALVPAAA